MKVTSSTRYKDFAPYEPFLTDESVAELKGAAEQEFKPCHTLTIDEFFGLLNGDYSLLGDMREPKVLQVYWAKRFKDFVDEFAKSCEALAMKDPENDGISEGLVKMTPQENMLTFVREYFGLPSFADAGTRTLGEYILARKDAFNKWKARKNMEKKQLAKLRSKK